MSYYANAHSVTPHFIPELKRELNLLNDLRAFIKIYELIKKENPDIIHTHTAKAGALGRLAAAIHNLLRPNRKIRIVHTFHGHILEGYFGRIKTRIFILIERLLAIFSDRIITLSGSVKREILSFGIGDENKVEVIPLGFELDNFLRIMPIERAQMNIGIVGRLVPISL